MFCLGAFLYEFRKMLWNFRGSFSSRDGKTYEALLQTADERLYKAKNMGKNCFCMI